MSCQYEKQNSLIRWCIMSKLQIVNELHRSARKNYPRRRVITKGIDDLWQCDLVEMIPYARINKGYKYLLTIIDVFSKFAWAEPIKSKSAENVSLALLKVFKQGRVPKNLQTDNGKEFYNSNFKELMKQYNVNHYSTYSTLKASVCERFNRTLKTSMWREFSYQGSHNWLNMLSKLVKQYNNKRHRTIGMKPVDVTHKNEKILLKTAYSNIKISGRAKLKIGDHVRISKIKNLFGKGYEPNWSTEVFKIEKIQHTNPITYKLQDLQDNPITGGFYELELLKTKFPNIYLVEKVLRTKGSKAYVKWLGFNKSFNSWVNKSDLIKK